MWWAKYFKSSETLFYCKLGTLMAMIIKLYFPSFNPRFVCKKIRCEFYILKLCEPLISNLGSILNSILRYELYSSSHDFMTVRCYSPSHDLMTVRWYSLSHDLHDNEMILAIQWWARPYLHSSDLMVTVIWN